MSTTAEKQATSPRDWRARPTPLELPSGNTCLVRKTSLEVFLAKGIIPNSLLPIITQALRSGKAPSDSDLDIDTDVLSDMVDLFNEITIHCVVEPDVRRVPLDEEGKPIPLAERDQDAIYIDEVDFEDKSAVFQWAISGVSRFQPASAEPDTRVADVPELPVDEGTTESAAGD